MENTTNNYDIPLRERNLAEEQQHSIKVKELLENIEKYKKKIIELTSQLDLLESLSAASKIAKVQDEVKKHCEICLEKDQNITQLKIEKEEEKIQYEQRLIKAEQKLEKLELESVTDPLTRLGNRAKFEKDLHNLIVSETQFSATVIDIDNFKQLNDTYGHSVGDIILKFIAKKLHLHINAYRWGGEEFIIIHECGENELVEKIKILKNSVNAKKWTFRNIKTNKSVKGKSFNVTFSAGVMAYNSKMSEKHFIDTVDRVMYYAKQQGGKDIVLGYQQVKHSLPKLNKTQQQANIPLEILHQTDKEDVQKTL